MLYDLDVDVRLLTLRFGLRDSLAKAEEIVSYWSQRDGFQGAIIRPREWDIALAGWRHDPPIVYVRS